MRRFLVWSIFFVVVKFSYGQVVTTNPAFPVADQPLTITVDVSGTSLDHYAWDNTNAPVYIWTWLKTGAADADAPTNVNPATSPAQDAAKCTRITTNPDRYQITFTPTTFFNKPAAQITQIGLKLKTKSWSDNKQTDVDKFITFTSGFSVKFTSPTASSFLVNTGEQIAVTLKASASSDMEIKAGGVSRAAATQNTTLSYTHTVTEISGAVEVTGLAKNSSETKTTSFTYIVRQPTVTATRPTGIVDGINYKSGDATKATLSLWAPGKNSVYVVGDFNNWTIQPGYQMKKDGEHFWLELSGLTSGTEYAFQYLVDETLKMADPYADKVLDPDDQYIPSTTYPNLKTYPALALNTEWYFNRVAVLQTGQTPYAWKTTNYTKLSADKLVIYELHIRDFFGSTARNYQSLIDTVSYFKKLGVNAIELMPVTEFNGNDSWGYNPTFMFAADKYYGTKNKLKEFIDKCHQNGIAVILDVVMNHHDLPNPYVMMDFDFSAMKPKSTNKWFNTTATHPYNVFFDMNHESTYTQKYLDTLNYYWLHEYKVDGYRYDLSKGFTQTNSGSDVAKWSTFDQSRINILKRMASKIRTHTPDAYIILEHFADNAEETALAAESMMLWGNLNYAYTQATSGFSSGSDISSGYYKTRGWTSPQLVTYMESHDEERMMYKALQSGNASNGYTVRLLSTALDRMKAAATMFYILPGPKMLWEFEELGYDQSINLCADGSISNDCRVSAKPVFWTYLAEPNRKALSTHTADMIQLRQKYSVFASGDVSITTGDVLVKQIGIKNKPYTASPADATQMNVQAMANFDVNVQTTAVAFPHTGIWYDYISGNSFNVTATPATITLSPGEYRLYTDVRLKAITAIDEGETLSNSLFYPNPTSGLLHLENSGNEESEVAAYSMLGQPMNLIRAGKNTWDIRSFSPGMYLFKVKQGHRSFATKIIKN